jgi:hypothetical protein
VPVEARDFLPSSGQGGAMDSLVFTLFWVFGWVLLLTLT